MDLDKIYQALREKEHKTCFESFNQFEKEFIEIMILWYEVGNGGIIQYYINTKNNFGIISQLLERIGALKLSKLMTEINETIINKLQKLSKDEIEKYLNSIDEQYVDYCNEFDNLLNEQDEEDIEELLIKYVKDHKDSFTV